MKFLSFILATYVCFLIVQPAMTFIQSSVTQRTEKWCGVNCCENKHAASMQKPETDKQDPSNCCPNRICNPFEHCTCCISLTVEQPAFQYVAIIVINEFILPSFVNLTSTYAAYCFRPPEIV